MSKSRILVPVDFSEQSRSALEVASSFAIIEDAELLIVHVIEDDFQSWFSTGAVSDDEAMKELDQALQEVKPEAECVPFTHRLLEGKPAKAILKLTEEENVELIVMGTHGRTGFKRMVLGSVAEEVVRKAKCPVLTLRKPVESRDKEPADIA